jgi:uncharacterized protein YgbK (DUF1537 family)
MTVRILADDLTGALDTAAGFTGSGPIAVRWGVSLPAGGRFAVSTETREAARDAAVARVAHVATSLPGPGMALKKVDSLLRGHVAAEIAATMRAGGFTRAIFAPAFPDRGRIMRGGMQHVRSDAGLEMIEADVGAELRRSGIATCTTPAELGAARAPCVWIADAQFDVDLREIVRHGRAMPGPLLWCGTAGLASALAEAAPIAAPPPRGRILAVSGSDHPVATAQIAAATAAMPDTAVRVAPDAPTEPVVCALHDRGLALLTVDLPPVRRDDARATIGRTLARLLPGLAPPDVLVAMGGETLRQCCDAVMAEGLLVDAQVEAGIAHARIQGGAWSGARVISKSGAFGDPGTLLRILGTTERGLPAQTARL